MDQHISVFRVFIASPSDLREERETLRDVVTEINAIFSRETDWRIELLGWEDTMPGGGRPQELINADVDRANLLIGCLWRRWGTDAGKGKTGFEEEFDRAVDRWKRTAEPDIWLFFKDISEEEKRDPGEQLKKVLAFQAAQEKAKRLLFQRFSDSGDWRHRIAPLLHRQLLRLASNKAVQPGGPAAKTQQPPTPLPSAAASAQPSSNPAVASIASLLRSCGEQLATRSLIEFRDSSTFNDAKCARLQVFASAMYNWKLQSVELGTHECNSIYWHRRGTKLTGQECLFLVRTVLMDSSLTKPGWFWTARWSASMTVWLPWLVRFDREERARIQALDFANDINFALLGSSTGAAAYAALSDTSGAVKLAALRYLREHGRSAAIRHVKPLTTDSAEHVRNEAIATIYAIRIRANPDREFRRVLQERPPLTDALFSALRSGVSQVTVPTLIRYLDHSNPKLRLIAAEQLQKRKELPLPQALQLTTDDSRLVREKAFYSLVDYKASPPPSDIRAQLAEHPSSLFSGFGETPDSDALVGYYFGKRTSDELWDHVRLMDSDSAIAMRIIGQRFFAQSADTIRDNLVDDFERIVAAAKLRREQQTFGISSYRTLWGGDPIENERQKVRVTALAALAKRPAATDRPLFKRFLSSELSAVDQTIACLRGLATIGNSDAVADLKPLLSNAPSSVRAAAARAYLSLSADRSSTVKDLLKAPSATVVFVVIAYTLTDRSTSIWPEVKGLLSSQDDDVRRLACHYATCVLSRRELHRLLNDYLKGGWYYYNVVTLLDRALYAAPNVRKYFRAQEIAHFSKLSDEVNRSWPGLRLVGR